MRRLFRYRQARRYLIGQSVSLFGDMTMWLAMGIWVKTLTGSNAAAGLTFFFFALPQLAAPLAGVLVDRFARRSVMIWANLATGVIVLGLLGVHGRGQVWLLYLVMFGYGLSNTVLGASGAALLRLLLPEELLADGNGYLSTVQEGLRLVGPITGATLFVIIGGAPLAAIDATTFLVAAIALWTVRVEEEVAALSEEPWRASVLSGVRHIRKTVELRQIVVAFGVASLVFGTIESAAFAVVGEGLHRPASFLGTLVAVQGAGAVVAGLTSGPATRRFGEGQTAALGLFAFAAGAGLLVDSNLAVVMAGVIAIGFSLPWLVVGATTALQRRTPLSLQGMVSAASTLLIGTPQIVSIATGAAIVSVLPYQVVLASICVVVAACGAYLVSRREQRVQPLDVATSDLAGPPEMPTDVLRAERAEEHRTVT